MDMSFVRMNRNNESVFAFGKYTINANTKKYAIMAVYLPKSKTN